jgi:hypothetical protein
MTLESQTRISLGHATAVIDDLNGCSSGIDDDNVDGLSTRIDSVLNEFLYHGGRALDDLTSGNLVGYAIGEKTDDI